MWSDDHIIHYLRKKDKELEWWEGDKICLALAQVASAKGRGTHRLIKHPQGHLNESRASQHPWFGRANQQARKWTDYTNYADPELAILNLIKLTIDWFPTLFFLNSLEGWLICPFPGNRNQCPSPLYPVHRQLTWMEAPSLSFDFDSLARDSPKWTETDLSMSHSVLCRGLIHPLASTSVLSSFFFSLSWSLKDN